MAATAQRCLSTVARCLLPVLALAACVPRPSPPAHVTPAPAGVLSHVRTASGRPPVVLVPREGDPAVAVAAAVTTAGVGFGDAAADDPEPAIALAGLVEARLRARSFDVRVTPAWDGLRVSALLPDAGETSRFVESLRDAFAAPAKEADLAAARKKLTALAQRPLPDRSLARWARCVGQPYVPPDRAGKDYADVDVTRLERWRAASFGLGRVAFGVTAPAVDADRVAAAVLEGPAWSPSAPLTAPAESAETAVDVFESPPAVGSVPVLHTTLDVGTSSAAVATADALGDPRGPLAARLSELDLPFRLREVTGTAHARGGCVGVVLEAAPSAQTSSPTGVDLAARVADALALVRVEAGVFIGEPGKDADDGRRASRLHRSGDAREAAERAAWWALADTTPSRAGAGSIVLALPSRRGAKETAVEPSRETLASAVARADAVWKKPIVEGRSRVEAGQSDVWVLAGSPCGADGESEADSGLTALFVSAAADAAKASGEVRAEPWVATDGAGVLVHGPALAGESPAAHARRIADIAARGFGAEPLASWMIGRARADLLRHDARSDGSAMTILAGALAPRHPSWVLPWGAGEPIARSSDGAVLLRAQALRAGPVRIAVLANTDASQADAAVRAADRWVARHTGETRACPPPTTAQPPKPGTYAVAARPGTVPEAYLAFPLPAGDEAAHRGALGVAAALSEDGSAWLDKALLLASASGTPLAREASARVLGWPRAPALVVRVVAPEATLDAAVMQTRALLNNVRASGVPAADLERASKALTRAQVATMLDPRARIVAAFRGEPVAGATARVGADDVNAFAQRHLVEDSMVVVAVRPPRPAPTP